MSKQIHMFEGMGHTRAHYTSSEQTDTLFAITMSAALKREYTTAQVRQYRKVLNIPNNAPRAESRLSQALSLLARVNEVYDPETQAQETLARKIDEFLEASSSGVSHE